MKRKVALLLACLFLLVLPMAACSAPSGKSASTEPMAPEAMPAPAEDMTGGDAGYGLVQHSQTAGFAVAATEATRKAKLIQTAQMSIQTLDYAAARDALDALTQRCGGYYESASTDDGDYYAQNASRYASYVIRVPQDRYRTFLDSAGDIGHVVSSTETAQDVGEVYYDIELRLKTQQTKQTRLLALLEKADKMEDIISLEGALTEVQYQIEQYTSDLKRYDSLVDYSTIRLDLREVVAIAEQVGETASLSARMGSAFSNGFADFGAGMSNLLLWAAYHCIGLLIFAAAVAVGATVAVKTIRKRRQPTAPPQEKDVQQ